MAVNYLEKLAPETEEEKANRDPMYKVFARHEWVIWGGVRHLMCRHCGQVLPEKGFIGVTTTSNFAVCYMCDGKKSP